MVALVRGSPGLSLASCTLCPHPLQAPLAPPLTSARERQRKSFERLDQAALLSARVQLDPSSTNRARLRAFLTLMAQRLLDDGDVGEA
jgi:hypothetical protein